jgi:hypothetical protein
LVPAEPKVGGNIRRVGVAEPVPASTFTLPKSSLSWRWNWLSSFSKSGNQSELYWMKEDVWGQKRETRGELSCMW